MHKDLIAGKVTTQENKANDKNGTSTEVQNKRQPILGTLRFPNGFNHFCFVNIMQDIKDTGNEEDGESNRQYPYCAVFRYLAPVINVKH